MTAKPKWWIAKAEARRVELDLGVGRLRDRLGSFPGVIGVLIFGSYARGDIGPESDLDLIVVRDTSLERGQRDDDIRAHLRLGVAYDLVTLTPSEYERLTRERSFYEQARREGVWIDAARPR